MRSSLPGFERSGGVVLERGSEEKVKELSDYLAGVLVVLMRARGESGGLCLGRATATARWRPAGGSVRVARRGERQREAKRQWRRSGATCGAVLQAGGGRAGPPRRRRRYTAAAWSRAGRQAGGRG